ncbi:B-box zinc finger protein, putative, partial [Eimeria necatrix]
SPFQFGQCPNHPSEMIDCVCMVCFLALCPHCILIGHHSAADFSEHPLISTLDAYKMSMQGTSPSEEALSIRREKIVKDLQENHQLLARLHANFASVHRKIDDSNKALMKQLQIIKQKQVGFLQALKRELLTECLIIEWMEAFFSHLQLALCPSDYLMYHHRHDLLAADLFGGAVRIEVGRETLPLGSRVSSLGFRVSGLGFRV